ncbi:MAG TPA: hypothetical protein VNY31_10470 [Solirubrobacteraceae bacterium]|nr:hypothetical protein [Solirubrobacteraceae bacterium]
MTGPGQSVRVELEECLEHDGWKDAAQAQRLCRQAVEAIRSLEERLRFQVEETEGAEETAREYAAERDRAAAQ